jgi:ABC-type hemin transport system ATPase subunit
MSNHQHHQTDHEKEQLRSLTHKAMKIRADVIDASAASLDPMHQVVLLDVARQLEDVADKLRDAYEFNYVGEIL